MGIMMLAVLSLLGMTDIHRMNALKTSSATLINGVAVVAFVVAGAVRWAPGARDDRRRHRRRLRGAAIARRVEPRSCGGSSSASPGR